MNKLVEDNVNLVYHLIARTYPTFIHDEDIIQSGMLGLCKAATNWDKNKSKFSTYASRCILNSINEEFRSRKRQPKGVSLDQPLYDNMTLAETVVGEEDVLFLDDETFYSRLSEEEQKVFKLYNNGYSTDEISTRLCMNEQKVRKILRLIKLKWREFYESTD